MKLYSKKDTTEHITINSKRNKILTTRGFVVITKGNHNGATTLHPEVLEKNYTIPKGTVIDD